MLREFLWVASMKCASALRQTVGCRGADGARAPNNHIIYGGSGFAKVSCGDDLKTVRQQTLFDQQHGIAPAVERNSAKMPGAPADGDVHGNSLGKCRGKTRRAQRTLILNPRSLAWMRW